jgi:hypothetical protein
MIERNDPPTCGGCRHYWSGRQRCEHPDLTTFDPIAGREGKWVRIARDRDGGCGPEGKRFEPYPPTPRRVVVRRALLWSVILIAALGWIASSVGPQ